MPIHAATVCPTQLKLHCMAYCRKRLRCRCDCAVLTLHVRQVSGLQLVSMPLADLQEDLQMSKLQAKRVLLHIDTASADEERPAAAPAEPVLSDADSTGHGFAARGRAFLREAISGPHLARDSLVIELDDRWVVSMLSRGAVEFHRDSPFGPMVGQVLSSLVHPDDVPTLRQLCDSLAQQDAGISRECQIRITHFSLEFSPGKPKTSGHASTEEGVFRGKGTDSVATAPGSSCPWTRFLDDCDDFNRSEAAMMDSCSVHQANSKHLSMQSPEAEAMACSSRGGFPAEPASASGASPALASEDYGRMVLILRASIHKYIQTNTYVCAHKSMRNTDAKDPEPCILNAKDPHCILRAAASEATVGAANEQSCAGVRNLLGCRRAAAGDAARGGWYGRSAAEVAVAERTMDVEPGAGSFCGATPIPPRRKRWPYPPRGVLPA